MASVSTLNAKVGFCGKTVELKARKQALTVRSPVVVKAEKQEVARRSALGLLAGAAALAIRAPASQAAYGEAANVFGKFTGNTSGFTPYSGEGYALLLPSKWNPSREQEFPGTLVRYEDNGDVVNNLVVIKKRTDKGSIDGFGSPDKFLQDFGFLLGQQTFTGQTRSEGGFAANKVSSASLLDIKTSTDKKGKNYYKFEVLTRSADGDEGGRHQLITATVSGGSLYILKVQAGDKRWFKGAEKLARGASDSFVVS